MHGRPSRINPPPPAANPFLKHQGAHYWIFGEDGAHGGKGVGTKEVRGSAVAVNGVAKAGRMAVGRRTGRIASHRIASHHIIGWLA
jgi:hypothetical protein